MKLKLALLGVWHVHAVHHLQDAIRHPQAGIVAVWDSDAAAGARFGAAHGLEFVADLEALLARPGIDGVVVDTATTEHPHVIGRAIACGKHVFTEKVLAVTTADALALVAAARVEGVILRVSLQRLREAPMQTVRHLIAEGVVGAVRSTRIRVSHHGALGVPWIPPHFFRRDQAGGGALIDLGAHPIYLGMLFHRAMPLRVSAFTAHTTGLEVEDNAVALLGYPGGAMGVAETSFVAAFFSQAVEVAGTEGTLVVEAGSQRVLLRRAGTDTQWVEQKQRDPLPATFDQFVAAVRAGDPDPQHLQLAVAVTRVIEAAYRSAASGQAEVIDASLDGRTTAGPG